MILSLIALLLQAPASAEILDRVVAVVNDEIITESDIRDFERKIKSGAIVDDLISENPKDLLKDRKLVINHLVDERVLDTEVKAKSLSVTFERVEQEVNKIAGKNGVSRKQLRQALKEQGVDFAEYQDFVKKRLERQSLIEQAVTSKVRISDEEVAAFYLSQKGAAGNESHEYTLSHILVLPRAGDISGSRKKAEDIAARIKKGESFEALAARYSEDPNFTQGGVLGTFRSGEFLKEMETAVQQMNPGDVSDVVETKMGFQILKLVTRRLVNDAGFEREKERIRGFLYQKAFKKQFSFWLDQKRRDSFIRINIK